MKVARLGFLIVSVCFAPNVWAQAMNDMFNFDGVLTDSSNAPIVGNASVDFKILDPSKACVLYEEQDAITTDSQGNFSIQIGSLTGAAKRSGSDPGNSMAAVFQNSAAPLVGGCGSYAPHSGDGRFLRVTVTPASTGVATTLTPDLAMGAAPTATVAETLQGIQPAGFLQTNTASDLTQTNVENVFSTTNYPILTSLLAGTSTLYVPNGTNGAPQLPQFGASGPTAPSVGEIWYDTSSSTLKYFNGSTMTLGTSSGGVTSISGGNGITASPTTITSSGTISVNAGTGANQIVQLNASAQLPAVDGSLLTNLSGAAMAGTIGGSTAINTTGNLTTTGTVQAANLSSTNDSTMNLLIYNTGGTKSAKLTVPSSLAANYTLVLPAALPAAPGYVLSSDTSGNLSWVAQTASSQWANSGANLYYSAGSVGIGTTAPAVSLDLGMNTDAILLPKGSTGQEPAAPVNGMLRYNTTTNSLEYYNGAWSALTSGGNGAYLSTTAGGSITGSTTFVGATTFSSTTTTSGISNGNYGITGAGNISGAGNITGGGAMTVAAGGTNQNLTLESSGTGAVNIGTGSAGTAMTIAGNGNVGIGTTFPSNLFEVDSFTPNASGNGLNVVLTAQSSSQTNGNGGNILLNPGSPGAGGKPGAVIISQGGTLPANMVAAPGLADVGGASANMMAINNSSAGNDMSGNNAAGFSAATFNNGYQAASYLWLGAAGGTSFSPTPVTAGTRLGAIVASGYNGAGFANGSAEIGFGADENFNASANGSSIQFFTTPNGSPSSAITERMRITGLGNVGIGTTLPGSPLTVMNTNASTSGPTATTSFSVTYNPSSAPAAGTIVAGSMLSAQSAATTSMSSAILTGAAATATLSAGAGAVNQLAGLSANATNQSSNMSTTGSVSAISASISEAANSQYNQVIMVGGQNASSATANSFNGVEINLTNSGTISGMAAALYIDPWTGAGTYPGGIHYGIFEADPASPNVFKGNVGIGTMMAPGALTVATPPTATANFGAVSIGNGPFDGTSGGFFTGNSSGTELAVNAASGFTGDLMNLETAGVPQFRVTGTGQVMAMIYTSPGTVTVQSAPGATTMIGQSAGASSTVLQGGTGKSRSKATRWRERPFRQWEHVPWPRTAGRRLRRRESRAPAFRQAHM